MKLSIGKLTVLFMALFLSLSTIFATTNTTSNSNRNNSVMDSIRSGITGTTDAITGNDNMNNTNSGYYNDNYNNSGTYSTQRSTGTMYSSDNYANTYDRNNSVSESNALRDNRTFDWITVGISVAAIATVLGVSYKLMIPDTDRM